MSGGAVPADDLPANLVPDEDLPDAKPKASALKPPKALKIGAEGLPDAMRAVAGDFNPLTQMAVGTSSRLDDYAMRLKQLLGNKLTPEEETVVKTGRALRDESGMANLGGIGFDIAATAGPARALMGGVTGLAAKYLPQGIAQILAQTGGAGLVGATAAATTDPNIGNETTAGKAAAGGIGGMMGDLAVRGAARVVQPITANPKVQELLNRDIVPTIGQAMDDKSRFGNFIKWGEEKMQSVPFVGEVIRNSRMRPKTEVNLAAIRTVDPKAKNIGHEGLREAEDYASGLYQEALSKIPRVATDMQFVKGAAAKAARDPNLLLTGEQRKIYDRFYNGVVLGELSKGGGQMTPEVAKKIDSEIGAKIRGLSSSTASDKDLAKAFETLQKEFRGLIERNAPAEAKVLLDEANKRWANWVRVRDAAASVGAKDGVFTPAQLHAAVRRGDNSVGKGRFAQGEALLQDLSGPAKSVLSDTVANSGTADRALFAHMLANPVKSLAVGLPSVIPAGLLYSRPGQRYMLGDLPGQGLLSQAIRAEAPVGAAVGGILNQRRTSWAGENTEGK